MKNFLATCIKFIPIALIGYVALLILWGELWNEKNHEVLGNSLHSKLHAIVSKQPKTNLNYPIANYGHTFSRLQDAKNATQKNILFLGSSLTYRGIDTRYFKENKISVFNLGSSAQTPIQTELLLKRYLDTIAPKLVLFEVSPGILNNSGEEAAIDIIANDSITLETVKMAAKVNRLRSYHTLIYGLYRQLCNRNNSITEHRWRKKDVYHRNGYVETKLKNYKTSIVKDRKLHQNPKQLAALDRIIQLLKQRNIRYYLIMSPKTKQAYASYKNINTHIDLLSARGSFINFQYLEKALDTTHFYDPYHLNQKGVLKYNQAIIDTLGLKSMF